MKTDRTDKINTGFPENEVMVASGIPTDGKRIERNIRKVTRNPVRSIRFLSVTPNRFIAAAGRRPASNPGLIRAIRSIRFIRVTLEGTKTSIPE